MAYFLANSNEYKDIDYEDWLLLTPAEQENGKYYIHGAPESKQKIVTDSGTFTDASQNTYTGVTTDMISYDATNNQLLLKVGGADSVIPFSRGSGSNKLEDTIFNLTLQSAGVKSYTHTFMESGRYLVFCFIYRDQYTTSASLSLTLNDIEIGENIVPDAQSTITGILRCSIIEASVGDVLKQVATYNTNGKVHLFVAKIVENHANFSSKTFNYEGWQYYNSQGDRVAVVPIANKLNDKLVITYLNIDANYPSCDYTLWRNKKPQGTQFLDATYLITISPMSSLINTDDIVGRRLVSTNGKIYSFAFQLT